VDLSKSGESVDPADRSSPLEQQNEAPEITHSVLETKRNEVDDIDQCVTTGSLRGSNALVDSQAQPAVRVPDPALLRFREIAVPIEDRRSVAHKFGGIQGLALVVGLGVLLVAIGLGRFGESLYAYLDQRDELSRQAAISAMVDRIIAAESNGDPRLNDIHSSAAGPGQFLDDTWLELIRQYRPDLTKGRSQSETLELRRDAKLSYEITLRFVERNAAILKHRGLPLTVGAIYLAHFAGPAGAVAILSAPENADAALVMASADTTGRISRDQLIKANPFLKHFTVADLKVWADRKMRGPDLGPANGPTVR
jgi:hypothetical protein